MDNREKTLEKSISMKELEGEALDAELTKEQKKAAIREARQMYGKNWKREIWGAVKSLRVDKETLHSLHGLGVDGSLKKYNDPSQMRRG